MPNKPLMSELGESTRENEAYCHQASTCTEPKTARVSESNATNFESAGSIEGILKYARKFEERQQLFLR